MFLNNMFTMGQYVELSNEVLSDSLEVFWY